MSASASRKIIKPYDIAKEDMLEVVEKYIQDAKIKYQEADKDHPWTREFFHGYLNAALSLKDEIKKLEMKEPKRDA